MYKNVKSKIILISAITGLILVGCLGLSYLNSINQIQSILAQENNVGTIIENVMEFI